MSEFDENLARAVEDGIARSRLPGAADAVRRGRRRTLRTRAGAALLGVAAIGGAAGVTASLGGGGPRYTVAVIMVPATHSPATSPTLSTSPATATTGRSASAPASSAESAPAAQGDGHLAANLWPGYALAHWAPEPSHQPGTVRAFGSVVVGCTPEANSKSFPITGIADWATPYDTVHHGNAEETVVTFADEAKAAAYLADTRHAGSAPTCGTGPTARVASPAASTGYGVSWLLTQEDGGAGHLPSVEHDWAVQVGNRVALLRVMQFGDDFRSTSGDTKVLADMQQALEK